jgi:GntR family transcriptional regulator
MRSAARSPRPAPEGLEPRPPVWPSLDKRSPVPLYFQLQTVIEERIDSGEWPPDTLLPSERELCDQFQISRITVRQALAELVREGRLVRSHGRGTFVAHSQLKRGLFPLIGFSEDIRRHGQRPGTRVLRFELMPAPPAVTRALQLGAGEKVVFLKRLRLANGSPMGLETAHLPGRLFPGILEETFEDRSLYELLREKYGVVPTRANQQWQAMECSDSDARLLGVRKGRPVLSIVRTTFDQTGRPFEQAECIFRGDKYVYYAELKNQE